ncbi:MAG: signal recognition particle-docking protein FtsY [Bacteroidota bacterium]|nr:signal recognition particle-docking protein FtsY [Bacteroidota bacterium]MDP4193928.1 signal recognition particle-docking protein FtsY [Bacteroidota bacterium]
MNLFKNINFNKLKDGLTKTRDKLVTKINETITGKAKLDEEILEEVEEILITSDIGYDTATRIIENSRVRLKAEKDRSKLNVTDVIKNELISIVESYNTNSEFNRLDQYKPYVILVVGVNGAGKTTTIGKLAHNYKQAGLSVIIGSADTFRAAANEQLEVWSKRAGVEIVQRSIGADPSAVAFDTVSIAKKKNIDIVMIDTAGRLHTKQNLMEELKKIKKSISKVIDYAPNETFLVIDGNTGQNALIQAEKFSDVTDITGLIVTKLDGTAKGGVVFQICSQQKVPIKYIGVGEGIDDLQTFDAKSFVDALFDVNEVA